MLCLDAGTSLSEPRDSLFTATTLDTCSCKWTIFRTVWAASCVFEHGTPYDMRPRQFDINALFMRTNSSLSKVTFVLDSFFSHGHAVLKRQRTRGFDNLDSPALPRLNEDGLLLEV